MRLFLLVVIFLCIKAVKAGTAEGQLGVYSNFIWRGVTFTENKPAVQGNLDLEGPYSFYVATFVSNAEFKDDYLDNMVTQEIDYIVGKRFFIGDLELQFYYSYFSFPNATEIDSDEFNFQAKLNEYFLELSYMDDYFGYRSIYKYVRVGYEWEIKKDLSLSTLVGYSDFSVNKGVLKQRCEDVTCASPFQTTSGAGSNDYVDVYIVGTKEFKNMRAELGFNFTNRYEYTAEAGEVLKDKAHDFAAVVAMIMPFTL